MPSAVDEEGGKATSGAAVWLADDPASSLRLALDTLDGNPVPQAEHLLQWALGQLDEVVVLRGHRNWVMSATYSRDGHFVLTASLDHTVSLWEADTGRRLASFDIGVPPRFGSGSPQFSSNGALILITGVDGRVHVGPWAEGGHLSILPISVDVKVNRAALALDDDHIITGHTDGTVRVSSLSVPDSVVLLLGTPRNDSIASVAFRHDTRYAAVGTRTGKIRMWELTRPRRPVVMAGHEGWVNTIEFSHDGRLLLSASDDETARLFSVPDGHLLSVLGHHTDRVNSATFSHNDKLVVTACVDKAARVFDTCSGEALAVLDGPDDELQRAVFSPNDRLVAMASVDGTCRICYAASGKTVFELHHDGPVHTVAFAPDGNSALTASADRTARLWTIDMGRVFWGHQGPVNTAVFSHDGQYVATAGEDGTTRVYELASGNQVALQAEHEGAVNSAAFSPDDRYIVTAGQDHTARVWEWQAAAESVQLSHDLEVDAAAFSQTGELVITSTRLEAGLWDWRGGQRRTTISLPADERAANPFIAIIWVDLSPDGSRVVTAHYDEKARLWDAATGNLVRVLEGHKGIVYTVAFDADGSHVITSGGDGTVRIWDPETGQQVHVLAGPAGQLRCAALRSDGLRAAGGAANGSVTIWDVRSERVLCVRRQHADLVMSVAFSPNGGAQVLTASDDGTAKAANVDSCGPAEEMLAIAHQRVWLTTGGSWHPAAP